ncbi:MAG TPA: nitrite/sulfite reductase [Phycisphaerae bacterium]|nr:nitrite/sulfite reductase [Phycisphaerae bacterium]
MAKQITPNFRTPDDALGEVERYKLASNGVRGRIAEDLRDPSRQDVEDATEQLAKSHGIYLEYNRDTGGQAKEWIYMIRVSIPAGGPLTREQWRVLDELSDRYGCNPEGVPSLRATTRQDIQFHWVRKEHVIEIVRGMAESGLGTLNGCGDNVRNVMACPLSSYTSVFDVSDWARRAGQYFRLPAEPHIHIFEIDPNAMRTPDERYHYGPKLLNRKFKIGFSAVHRTENGYQSDNCVELRTNDVGIAPLPADGKVDRFMVYIGGGQGERNGKPTFCALGGPFGVFAANDLIKGLDAIVHVQEEWGDRQNRHWARLKYVVHKMGMEWFREQTQARGARFDPPIPEFDPGPRCLHHGWIRLPSTGRWAYGAFIENGRIIDGSNGRQKTMVRHLMENYPIRLAITPNDDLLFLDIPDDARKSFEADMRQFGYGRRNGREFSVLRRHSVACVGLKTCRLSYTESERCLPEIVDQMEDRGWGDRAESIGMSGCERQCSRPATKAIGWVGAGVDRYQLKLMGTEDGRHQGIPIVDEQGRMYLKSVHRDELANVMEVLFEYHRDNGREGESLGDLLRRVGMAEAIRLFKENTRTANLMEKTAELLNDAARSPETLFPERVP